MAQPTLNSTLEYYCREQIYGWIWHNSWHNLTTNNWLARKCKQSDDENDPAGMNSIELVFSPVWPDVLTQRAPKSDQKLLSVLILCATKVTLKSAKFEIKQSASKFKFVKDLSAIKSSQNGTMSTNLVTLPVYVRDRPLLLLMLHSKSKRQK